MKISSVLAALVVLVMLVLGLVIAGATDEPGALAVTGGAISLDSVLGEIMCVGGGQVGHLTPAESANAQSVVAVVAAASDGNLLAERIALMTALADSGLQDLGTEEGNDGFLGIFQQRASENWGTAAQEMDPADVTAMFVRRLLQVPECALRQVAALYRPSLVASSTNSRVVVLEGPIDALAIAAKAATMGAPEVVLPVSASGTAVSDAQWDTILGLSFTAVLLAADGDDAGRQANARWSAQLVQRGHPHEIITWPEGADPASYLADHELDTCLTITIPGEQRRMRLGARGPRRVLRAIPRHSSSPVSEEAALATSMATSMAISTSTSTSTAISPSTHGYLSIGA